MRTINKKDFSRLNAVQLATLGEPVAVTNYGKVLGYWLPTRLVHNEMVAALNTAARVRAGEDGT